MADLERVLGHPDQVPVGFRRSVYQALARVYAALGRDADARLELAPRVYVAQGYDFGDVAFVLTDDGIVAVDAGTTEARCPAQSSRPRVARTDPGVRSP